MASLSSGLWPFLFVCSVFAFYSVRISEVELFWACVFFSVKSKLFVCCRVVLLFNSVFPLSPPLLLLLRLLLQVLRLLSQFPQPPLPLVLLCLFHRLPRFLLLRCSLTLPYAISTSSLFSCGVVCLSLLSVSSDEWSFSSHHSPFSPLLWFYWFIFFCSIFLHLLQM